MNQDFDIVVAGAGIVGAATALALARDRWKVALVEAGPAPELPSSDAPLGIRVSTLNPAAIQLLRQLNIWPALPENRLAWFDRMTVWEAERDLGLTFSAADAHIDQLGCVVENTLLAATLWQACERETTVFAGNAIEALEVTERHAALTLADGRSMTAGLVVAADGSRSALRELAGIEVDRHNYQQRGLVATVAVEDHGNCAWQRFLPTGPLAFLPLPDAAASIVWSVPDEQAELLLELDEPTFLARLSEAAQGCVGEITAVSQRSAFPLTRLHADSYVSRRLVLVGDAAHVVHPLAGQGANLGLLDAAALRDVLAGLSGPTANPAEPTALRRYGRWRRSDNAIMVHALHQIAGVYARDTPGWRGLRLLGARAINQAGWLRGMLVQHASGFGGKVPTLVQSPSTPQ